MLRIATLPSHCRKTRHRNLLLERLEDRSLLTAGALDPTFGDGGRASFDFGSFQRVIPPTAVIDFAQAVAVQSDGKIVVAGSSYASDIGPAGSDFALVRYNGNGSLDTSFGTNGRLTIDFGGVSGDYASGVAIQSDGKIVIVGYSFGSSAGSDFLVARLNSSGTLDGSFNGTGKQVIDFGGTDDHACGVIVQADGKIVVAGTSYQGATGNDFAVARLNSDGSLDGSFDTDGKQIIDFGTGSLDTDTANALALQPDGKIVVVGGMTTYYEFPGQLPGFNIARLNMDGSLDNTFGWGGIEILHLDGSNASAHSVAVQADGQIVVAGDSNWGDDFAVLRLDNSGAVNATFDSYEGLVTVSGVHVQADGKVVFAGRSFGISTVTRLNADFTLDTSFGTAGSSSSSVFASALALQSDGKIDVVGDQLVGGQDDFSILRMTSNGSPDSSFGNGGTATTDFGIAISTTVEVPSGSSASQMAVQPDGKTIVAGSVYSDDVRTNDFAIVRYNQDGTPDSSFGSAGKVVIDFGGNDGAAALAIQSDGKIVVVGSSGLALNAFEVVRLHADGNLDMTFNGTGTQAIAFDTPSIARAVAIQSDGKIVVAGTSADNFAVARLTVAGNLDTTFDGDGLETIDFGTIFTGSSHDAVSALAIQPDGKILVVGNSNQNIAAVRLKPDGSLDNSSANGNIPFGPVVSECFCGSFSFVTTTGKALVAVSDFNQAAGLALKPDGTIVIAGSTSRRSSVLGDPNPVDWDFTAIRLKNDGALDSMFGDSGYRTFDLGSASDLATSIALQPDGKLIISGMSSSSPIAVRITNAGSLDPTFGASGLQSLNTGAPRSMVIQPDGRALIADSGDMAIVRLQFDPSITATAGNDTIRIDSGSAAGAVKVSINGIVQYDGVLVGPIAIDAGDGDDTIIINAAPTGGVIINGQNGSDQYTVNFGNLVGPVGILAGDDAGIDSLIINGTAGDDYIFKDSHQVTFGNPVQQTVLYSGIETKTIHGGAGNDTIVDPGENTFIFGDAGNDTIIITSTSGNGVFVDGGSGSDNYIIGGGNLAGPVTVADSGTSGTDRVTILGTSGDDTITQTGSGFVFNGTAINITGLEAASVDGGGGTGDSFTVEGTPAIPTTVQGVSDTVISGTDSNDTIRVTATNNPGEVKVKLNGVVIGTFQPSGSLTLNGLGGDDDIQIGSGVTIPTLIDGGAGDDTLAGGGGDDTIIDLSGNNIIHAGKGNDTVIVGDGNNQIWTDGGDDYVLAGNGNNEIRAGKGNNAILVGDGNNQIWTTGGIDSITAGDGANQIHSGGDFDTIVVGHGNNQIWGQGGPDFITAGNGNNTITAGSGDDTIIVGNGNNTIKGGAGNDTITAGHGSNIISAGAGDDTVTITGSGNNTIDGGAGSDYITITGSGNNTIDGGAGDDYLSGGSGNDSIDGGAGDDVIFGGLGDDILTGGAGNDFLIGGGGQDRISGGAGHDILVAGDVDATLDWLTLYDISQAWALSHTVDDAESISEVLDETLGDANSDQLTGGAGADLFLINTGDTITDFVFGKPNKNKDGDVVVLNGVVTT